MAADTPLKRYSAMNLGSPWRNFNVVPQASISAAERTAVMFLYAGITGASPTPHTRNGFMPIGGGGPIPVWS